MSTSPLPPRFWSFFPKRSPSSLRKRGWRSVSAEMTCLEGGREAASNFAAVAAVMAVVIRSHGVCLSSSKQWRNRIRGFGRLTAIQNRRRTWGLLIRSPWHWRGNHIIRTSAVALPQTGYATRRLGMTQHGTTTSTWKQNSTQRNSSTTNSLSTHLRAREWLGPIIVVVIIARYRV